jgi:hypothetical protein
MIICYMIGWFANNLNKCRFCNRANETGFVVCNPEIIYIVVLFRQNSTIGGGGLYLLLTTQHICQLLNMNIILLVHIYITTEVNSYVTYVSLTAVVGRNIDSVNWINLLQYREAGHRQI